MSTQIPTTTYLHSSQSHSPTFSLSLLLAPHTHARMLTHKLCGRSTQGVREMEQEIEEKKFNPPNQVECVVEVKRWGQNLSLDFILYKVLFSSFTFYWNEKKIHSHGEKHVQRFLTGIMMNI